MDWRTRKHCLGKRPFDRDCYNSFAIKRIASIASSNTSLVLTQPFFIEHGYANDMVLYLRAATSNLSS